MENNNDFIERIPDYLIIGGCGILLTGCTAKFYQKHKQGKINKEQIYRFVRNASNVVSVIGRHANIACEEYKNLSNAGSAV